METPQVPPSTALRFQVRLRTRWVDEDNQAVLNNSVYLTLMEEGRLAYFTELGLMDGTHFPFVLAAANLRFIAPGRGGREVLVEMGTLRLGKSSFEQGYRIKDAESGQVWCEAVHLLVAWNTEKRTKQPIHSYFRARVTEYEGL